MSSEQWKVKNEEFIASVGFNPLRELEFQDDYSVNFLNPLMVFFVFLHSINQTPNILKPLPRKWFLVNFTS